MKYYISAERIIMTKQDEEVYRGSSLSSMIQEPTLSAIKKTLDDRFDLMLQHRDKGLVYTWGLDWFKLDDVFISKSDDIYTISGPMTYTDGRPGFVIIEYCIMQTDVKENN